MGNGRPIDVLLVEDNPGDIYLISSALAQGAIEKRLSVVTDGAEAIDYLERRGRHAGAAAPDLVLLDLNLPKVDGRDVLTFIKNSAALRHISVLIFSTSDRETDIKSAYESHANCYLHKPVDLDEYLDIVQQIETYWLTHVQLC